MGVILTPNSSQLYKANCDKQKNISLMGRVQIIRMDVLPRMRFLFCSLPITVPVSIFKFLDRLIYEFIWQNKRPRVRLKGLLSDKEKGGLALPHFRSYFWASQLWILVSWIRLDMETKWAHIEQSSVTNISISALPFMEAKVWRKFKIQNESVNHTLNQSFPKCGPLPPGGPWSHCRWAVRAVIRKCK